MSHLHDQLNILPFLGCNTICIDLWRDHGGGGGKYLQSIHFGFALGAFIGPLVAEPFLSIQQHPEMLQPSLFNKTIVTNIGEKGVQTFNIFHLFPILGGISCLVSIGYFAYEVKERNQCKDGLNGKSTLHEKEVQENMSSSPSLPKKPKLHSAYSWTFLGIMLLFFICYVGIEATLSSLLSAFSVNSNLQLTQQEGTVITSYFWVAFATTRLLYIFVPSKVSSVQGICLSLSLINIGCTLLCIYANTSKVCLSIFSAIVGSALGPTFGNFVMYLERHLIVDAKVCAVITIFGSIGGSVIPTLVGQLILEMPMFLMYLIGALSVTLILLFGTSFLVGRKILSM